MALLTVNVQKDVLSRCSVKDAPAVVEKIKALRDAHDFKVVAHIRTAYSTNHHSFQSSNPGSTLLDKAPCSETRNQGKESGKQSSKRKKVGLHFDECIMEDYCVLGTDGANFSEELPIYESDVIIDILDGHLNATSRVAEKSEEHRGLLDPSVKGEKGEKGEGQRARNSSEHVNRVNTPFLIRIFHGNDISQLFIAGFGLESAILRTVLKIIRIRRLLGNEMQITVLTDACRSMGNIFNAAANQAKVDSMLRIYCTLKESYNIAVPAGLRKQKSDSKKKKGKRALLPIASLANNAVLDSRLKIDVVDIIPPLHRAVSHGNLDEVRRIVKAHSSGTLSPDSPDRTVIDTMIMKQDCFGNSAVVLACQISHNPTIAYQILAILLSWCSDHTLPLATNTAGWSDMTPLMHAVVQQNHNMVELLLWNGATVDTQKVAACGKNVLAFALSTSSADFDRAINIANTLITRVIRVHTFEAKEVPVDSDANAGDNFGAFAREEEGFSEVDQSDADKAINCLSQLFVQPDNRGWSCIHHASKTDFLSHLSLVPFGAYPGIRANLNLTLTLVYPCESFAFTFALSTTTHLHSSAPTHSHQSLRMSLAWKLKITLTSTSGRQLRKRIIWK